MTAALDQRVKRARRALVFDGWGWEFTSVEGGGRAR